MAAHPERPEGSKRRAAAELGVWVLPAGLLGGLTILCFTWPPLRSFVRISWGFLSNGDREGFSGWIEGFGTWGAVVIVATMLFQTLAAFIPSLLIMVVAVLAYGPVWGGVLNVVGLLVAAAMAYGIYVGGVLRMGFGRFMTATAAGMAPFTGLVSWLGEETSTGCSRAWCGSRR